MLKYPEAFRRVPWGTRVIGKDAKIEGVPEERWISSTFPPNSPRCLRQGQVTEAWLDFLVDMQVGDQGDLSAHHLPGWENDTGAAADRAQPVAQAAVRAFESDGLVLAGIMPA